MSNTSEKGQTTMYSSVVTGSVGLDLIDDLISRWTIAAEEFKKAAGYKSGYLMVDRKNGKSFVFNLWESEAAANAFETSGEYSHVTQAFLSLMTSMPIREVFEVSASVHSS